MNTIAILTKLFPKSVAKIKQSAVESHVATYKSNADDPWIDEDHDPWIDEDHDRLVWEEEQHQEYIDSLRAIAAKDLIAKYPEYYKEYLVETLNLDPCSIDFEDYVEHRQQLEEQERERIAEIEASKKKEASITELSAFIGKFCGTEGLSIDPNLIEADDRIHLHSKRGVYTVVRKRDDYITLTAGTLQGKMFVVPISDVKCFYDHNKTMVRKLLKP